MKKQEKPRILVSAAMRSGSTLVSNILNANRDVLIFENFHFKRFIYQNGDKLTKDLMIFKVKEMALRLQLRYGYKVNSDTVIKKILKKKINYKNLYDELIEDQKVINKVPIVGEDSAMNWRFIPKFIELYKNAKVIHIIRDPRSIFASWKKATYQTVDYWGCIFNCMDNMNYAMNYSKTLPSKNYFQVKFEDILKDPLFYSKKISKFLNIEHTKDMISPKKWEKLFEKKNADLGWSSIEKKRMNGFYKNRINAWSRILDNEEIFVIQSLLKNQMTTFDYKLKQVNSNYMSTFFKCVNKSLYLKKIFLNFLEKNQGTDLLKDNPTDCRTWGDGTKNKKKFIFTKNGKKYLKELQKLKKLYLKNEK